jgi:hypothetical protein
VDALYETRAKLCYEQVGDVLQYMGTNYIVQDLDFLSRKIEGAEVPM